MSGGARGVGRAPNDLLILLCGVYRVSYISS